MKHGKAKKLWSFNLMGYEVEIKFHVADAHALEKRLHALGAKADLPITQDDAYLSHPSRDFAITNEAFRIRRDGSTNRVTYKGPKHEGPTKTREEIEIAFENGDQAHEQMGRLLERLGFRPVLTIHKIRQTFHLERQGKPIEVTIDEAEGLGLFAEVEALADDRDLLPQTQALVLDLARELGLDSVEPRSYLRMHLERDQTLVVNPPVQT